VVVAALAAVVIALSGSSAAFAAPSKNATLVISFVTGTGAPLANTEFFVMSGRGSGTSATTSARGVLRVTQPVYDWAWQVSQKDAAELGSFSVGVKRASTVDLGTIPWVRAGSITGAITGKKTPHDSGFVSLVNRAGRTVTDAQVGSDRTYRFAYAVPGEYTVRYRDGRGWNYEGDTPMFANATFTALDPAAVQTIDLTARPFTAKLSVNIAPKRDATLSTDLSVRLIGGADQDTVSTIVGSGRQTVKYLPAGRVVISASAYKARASYFSGDGKSPSIKRSKASVTTLKTGSTKSVGTFRVSRIRFQDGWI